MNEVSCKVFGVFWQPLADKHVTDDEVIAGTSVPIAKLRDKKERIDWSQFAAIMHNLRPHFTDDELVELGRTYLRSPGLKFAFVIGRLLFSPMDFYRWFSKPREGVGNQMFACVVPSHRELGPNEIELDLSLPEGFEVCWEFFVISSGNMEEMPRLLGLPRAQVKLSRIPHGGRMHILVPHRIPILTRIFRAVSWPFTARAAARELKAAHETLLERYEDLERARITLDRQATQLRTAHAVNTLIRLDVDLEQTARTVVRALVDEAKFTGARLELFAFAGEPPVTADAGRPADVSIKQSLESRTGEALGELTLWAASDASRADYDELLALITPPLGMALQNAVFRTGLQRLVNERTTELRQARDKLAGTVDDLRDAQGARERFFANISHEIRTPLSLIMLATSDIELRAGASLDTRARSSLGAVNDSARKLVRLVDELLLLAAGQENKLKLHPEPTDLAALVNSLASAWRPAAEAAGHALELRTTPVIANVDPVALERVASNLLSNALKYTPRGGCLELELGASDAGIRLSIFDTGPGIPAELAGRLFGRFERADDARRTAGTGIGLALVKQLVEAHGGTVEALARAGGGTELRVSLPAELIRREIAPAFTARGPMLAPTVRAVAHAGSVITPPGVSQGTILLAEDDVGLAQMIAQLLGDEYKVIVAHDGLAALDLVRQHQPQLLITDVDMPGLDGIELSRKFRELTGDRLAPIIILSAILDLGTRVAGLDAGATDYVTKPFDPLELIARVRAQLRMRDLAVRLHRAEQLSSLGILTSGLAHELRNPANGVVNAVAPLLNLLPPELTGPDQPVGQLLEVIQGCADQIGMLSRQLLGFRNGELKLDLRPVVARELIQRSISLSQTALTGLVVRTDVQIERPLVCAPPLLTQVLTNLIENAAHAAGRGGWVEVAGRSANGRITLEVSDSGPGVPLEMRQRVFEPFFTTKAPGVGTGLGLSVSRDIVNRHGGVLEIRDRGGKPVFVVDLPMQSALDVAANAV